MFYEVENTIAGVIGYDSIKLIFHRFSTISCLGESHEQSVDVFFNCTLLKQTSKLMCGFHQTLIVQISSNDDTGRIQVIVKSFGFTQELRAEDNILGIELLTHRSGISNRDSRWHDHVETLYFENGKSMSSRVFKELFYGHTVLRPSCYECPYKSVIHPGDITIADYWGIEKAAPEFDDNKGVSLVLVNNEAGEKAFEKVKEGCKRCRIGTCSKISKRCGWYKRIQS